MKSKWLLLILFCLFFALQPHTEAQDSFWRVWLHEPAGRHLMMVEDTGEVLQDITLPVPDLSYSIVSRTVGISHDGNLIAYFLTNETGNIIFQLYDVAAMTMYSEIYTPPLTNYGRTSLDIVGGSKVFSIDDIYLAVAVQMDAYWEIVLIDTTTRTVVSTLRSSDTIASAAEVGDGYGLPAIQAVDSDTVHFSYIDSMDGSGRYRSFVWKTSTSELSETNLYPHLASDRFEPTGEALVSYQNESYPNNLELIEGIPIQLNVIQVNTPTNPPFVWFNNESSSLAASFVQNGQRIMVWGWDVQSFEPHWALLERDLTVLHSAAPPWEFYGLAGVGDGFLYIATNVTAGGEPALIHHNTEDGTLDNVENVWISSNNNFVEIAWVEDVRFELAGDFLPWAQFDDLIVGDPPAPTALVPATSEAIPTSLAPLGITVGVRAIIVTTEGDMLNVRSGAGISFALLYQFANDTRVTILEGPISADGFTWWRVRADDGREGWVVDFADGVSTLIRE
jgi:hypothetical protein